MVLPRMTPEDALALFLQLGLSKENYCILRQNGIKYGLADFYPPYSVLQREKEKAYPKNISASSTEAQVPLQAILDHTIQRLMPICQEALELAMNANPTSPSVLSNFSSSAFPLSTTLSSPKSPLPSPRIPLPNSSLLEINPNLFNSSDSSSPPTSKSSLLFLLNPLPTCSEPTSSIFLSPDSDLKSSNSSEPSNSSESSLASNLPRIELVLIHKWGFDGSGNQAVYSQTYLPTEPGKRLKIATSVSPQEPQQDKKNFKEDEALFATSMVPLVLKYGEIIIWKNPQPGSSQLCRPIHLQFKKESKETSQSEEHNIEEQIGKLKKTVLILNGRSVHIKHEMIMSMTDGKVSNNLTDTGHASCLLCGATPKEMNRLAVLKQKKIDKAGLKYGLHTLHLWIRALEYCLQVSYRLDLRKPSYSKLSNEEKELIQAKKELVQRNLWEKLHIAVDFPGGIGGNSNSGPTARKFFRNIETVATITKLDSGLLISISTFIRALNCGFTLDPEKMKKFGETIYQKCVTIYPWYWLPSSLHIAFLHGWLFVDDPNFHHNVPVAWLSEESSEATNKEYRRIRLFHARKNSRRNNILDVFHYRCACSDPLMASKIVSKKKTDWQGSLTQEVLALLK
eukprot:Pompholyxophrys_sp_v1_NODE_53_length_2879_cov_4.110127.p1 type:complete len:624 gc:universal NODE_53_length_2879_cov_4.110127:949-2820(+)